MWDDDLITTYEQLLERVDEYTLYQFYLGFAPELDMTYRSPIREDDLHPSWSLFTTKYRKNVEYMWKDKGGKGESGDIFGLIRRLYDLRTTTQVLARVKSDFALGPPVEGVRSKLAHISPPTPSPRVDIRVKSKAFDRFDLNWWKGWNVDKELLERYCVTRIKYYFKYIDQENPYTPKSPAYAYRIMGKYKLYFPFERKQDKFRNELTDRELEGFTQLEYSSPLLIITKSMKDVLCLRSFGYEAVSPRGESVVIPGEFIQHFQEKYLHQLILFDNDGKHKAEDYPWKKIWVPPMSGCKDITDFNKRYGPQETANLLKQLTDGHCSSDPKGDRPGAVAEVPW